MAKNYCGQPPLVLDLEDSSGAEAVSHAAVGHGAEGRAAHVKVRRLGEAGTAGAGVGDGDGHRPAGAGSVARAPNLQSRRTYTGVSRWTARVS